MFWRSSFIGISHLKGAHHTFLREQLNFVRVDSIVDLGLVGA